MDTATSQFIRQDSAITLRRIVLTPTLLDGPKYWVMTWARPSSHRNSPFQSFPFLAGAYSSYTAARAFLMNEATTITPDLHWWFELRDIRRSDWLVGMTLTRGPGRSVKLSWDQKSVEVWIGVAFLL
ncbi:MAG: hypothetical protein V1696_01910 [Candidatus Jorgensenbacteria bacterium]